MPARKPPASDEKPQFERFIETARKIGASETDAALERAIKKIAPARRPASPGKPAPRWSL
jgi:hypothetical protein